jgi:adenylosuccinate lyase
VLLALVASGLTREDAYALVQAHAMAAWQGGATFRERLAGDPAVKTRLGAKLAECFDVAFYLTAVDALFERAKVALRAPVPAR